MGTNFYIKEGELRYNNLSYNKISELKGIKNWLDGTYERREALIELIDNLYHIGKLSSYHDGKIKQTFGLSVPLRFLENLDPSTKLTNTDDDIDTIGELLELIHSDKVKVSYEGIGKIFC